MKHATFTVILLLFAGLNQPGYSLVFTDDFNDGALEDWTPKQGDWTNPGDHLLSSLDNYGVIWRDGSFGYDQYLAVDAYFDDAGDGEHSKTAHLMLRGGESSWGRNRYYDHAYRANVQRNGLRIFNNIAPFNQYALSDTIPLDLEKSSWVRLAFAVTGTGPDTRLRFWVDNQLKFDGFDTSGSPHDDGGYVALGSSNHINRRIKYDNAYGRVDEAAIPESRNVAVFALVALGAYVGYARSRRRSNSTVVSSASL